MNFSRLCLIISIIIATACSSTNKGQSKDERKARIYYTHGTSKLLTKDYSEALEYLTKAVDLVPDSSETHNNLGMAYYFKGKPDKAIQHLRVSLKYNPKNSDARNNLASVYFQEGDLGLALKHYEMILNDLIYRRQYRVYYNMALIYLQRGQTFKAEDFLNKSIKDNKNYCPAYFEMGKLFTRKKEFKKALDAFHEGSKGTCYTEPAPLYFQGLSLLHLKQYLKAKQKFQEVQNRFATSHYSILATNKMKEMKNNDSFNSAQNFGSHK